MSARTTRALQAMQKDKIVRWLRTKLKVPPPSSASESAADAEMVDRSPPPIDPSLAAGIAASAASLASLRTNVNATSSQSIPLSADAPLDDHLRFVSRGVWGVDLRDMQLAALLKIFRQSKKLLIVQQTGTGKSHIFRMLGTMLNGIHLVMHPLLVLTADQIVKFQQGDDRFGAIEVHNLDEQASRSTAYRKKLIERMEGLLPSSTSYI